MTHYDQDELDEKYGYGAEGPCHIKLVGGEAVKEAYFVPAGMMRSEGSQLDSWLESQDRFVYLTYGDVRVTVLPHAVVSIMPIDETKE